MHSILIQNTYQKVRYHTTNLAAALSLCLPACLPASVCTSMAKATRSIRLSPAAHVRRFFPSDRDRKSPAKKISLRGLLIESSASRRWTREISFFFRTHSRSGSVRCSPTAPDQKGDVERGAHGPVVPEHPDLTVPSHSFHSVQPLSHPPTSMAFHGRCSVPARM